MGGKVFKGVYVLVLVFLIFLAIKGAVQSKGAPEEFAEKIIEVEDAKVLEENEGKLVLISGKMEASEYLEFKDQGVKVKSPILERKVEMYQYIVDDNDHTRIERRWSKLEPEKTLYDEKTNKYYKNPNMEIKDEKNYTDAKVGEFTIDADTLVRIQPDKAFKDFEIPEGYRVEDETVLLTAHDKNTVQVGDYRMQFSYLDVENDKEFTFIGKQENGKINEYTLDTGKKVLEAHKGTLNKDEAIKTFAKGETAAKYVSLVLIAIMLVFGFFIFKPKKDIA